MAANSAAVETELEETSYTTIANTTTNQSKAAPLKKKSGKKAKLTAKEKKERSVRLPVPVTQPSIEFTQLELEKIISTLPLEFRGSDPVCACLCHHSTRFSSRRISAATWR